MMFENTMLNGALRTVSEIGVDVAIKATVVLLAALAAHWAWGRRRKPVHQSAVCNGLLVALLALPIATSAFPRLRIYCLPPAQLQVDTAEPEKGATPAIFSTYDSAKTFEAAPIFDEPNLTETGPVAAVEHSAVPRNIVQPEHPAISEASAPVMRTRLTWPVIVWSVYVLGLLILAFRLLMSLAAVARLRRQSQPLSDTAWTAAVDRWREHLGIKQPVRIATSGTCNVPMVFGRRNPIVLIPDSPANSISDESRDAILLHELAHVRRQDYAWQLLLRVAQVVYWPHPLIWLLARITAAIREQACDDLCAYHEARPAAYRRALVQVATQITRRPTAALGIAMARSARLETRLSRLERGTRAANCLAKRPVRLAVALLALATAGVVGSAELARRESQPEPNADASQNPDGSNADHPFRYSLSDVTVELVSVTNNRPKRDHWWKPDGTSLSEPLYDRIDGTVAREDQYEGYEFTLKITGGEDENDETPQGLSSRTIWESPYRGSATESPSRNGKRLTEYQTCAIQIPRERETVDLRIGRPTGPWQTIALSPGTGGIIDMRSGKSVAFGEVVESGGMTKLSVSESRPSSRYLRVLAIDGKGATHHPTTHTAGESGDLRQSLVAFSNLPKDDIREFELQVRDTQWIDFKNISLRDGRRSDVQISDQRDEAIPSDVDARLADGAIDGALFGLDTVAIDLVAITTNPPKPGHWWKPDGTPLDEPLYDHSHGSVAEDNEHIGYEFTLKLVGEEENPPIRWFVPNANSAGGGSPSRGGETLHQFKTRAFLIERSRETVDLQVGLPSGSWRTVVESPGDGSSVHGMEKMSVAFSDAVVTDGMTRITVSESNFPDAFQRIIAVDKAGNTHHPSQSSMGVTGELRQTTVVFRDLPIDHIDTIQLQHRDIFWFQIKNISLRRGQKSNVRVKLGENKAAGRAGDAARSGEQLVGINGEPRSGDNRRLVGGIDLDGRTDLDPRPTVRTWMDHALKNEDDAAAKLILPGKVNQTGDFREMSSIQKIEIADGYASESAAMVVTRPIKGDRDREGCLVFRLQRQNDKWLIRDIDFESVEETAGQTEGFSEHPGVQHFREPPPRMHTPASAPAGESAAPNDGHTFIVAEHAILFEGKVVTWEELETLLKSRPDRSQLTWLTTHNHIRSESYEATRIRVNALREHLSYERLTMGSVSPRASERYDAIRTQEDVPYDLNPHDIRVIVAKNVVLHRNRSISGDELEQLIRGAHEKAGFKLTLHNTRGASDSGNRKRAEEAVYGLMHTLKFPVHNEGMDTQHAERCDALQPGEDLVPTDGRLILGRVLTSDGEPAAFTQVVLCSEGEDFTLYLEGHRLRDPEDEIFVDTDAHGRFSLNRPEGRFVVAALHPTGIVEFVGTQDTVTEEMTPELRLQPWGRVEGTLHIGSARGKQESIALNTPVGQTAEGTLRVSYSLYTETNDEGHFKFDHVPASSSAQISRMIEDPRTQTTLSSHPVTTPIEAGATATVTIGGTGRPVVGQIQFTPESGISTKDIRIYGWARPEGIMTAHYAILVGADGRYRIENVPPGKYLFHLTLTSPTGSPSIAEMSLVYILPEIPGGRSDEPYDVGTFEVKLEPDLSIDGDRLNLPGLAFAILPRVPADESTADLTSERIERLRTALSNDGPGIGKALNLEYQWFELHAVSRDALITGEHDGRKYVLAHMRPDHAMVWQKHGVDAWSLAEVEAVVDNQDRPTIEIELDDAGGKQLAELTRKHLREPLAVVFKGRVIFVATIQSEISDRIQITGSFDEGETRNLVESLNSIVAEPAR